MTNAIELSIKTKEAEVNLNMKSASQQDRTHLLNVLGGLVNAGPSVSLTSQGLTINPDKAVVAPAANQVLEQARQKLNHTNPTTTISDKPKESPIIHSYPKSEIWKAPAGEAKQIPLGDERTPMVSLGEKLQAAVGKKEEEPEWYKTGIKIDGDGTKRYKCRFECDCGRKGNHYIEKGTEEVPCFDCGAPLEVQLATGEVDALGIPNRDDWGNYYVAYNYPEDGEE